MEVFAKELWIGADICRYLCNTTCRLNTIFFTLCTGFQFISKCFQLQFLHTAPLKYCSIITTYAEVTKIKTIVMYNDSFQCVTLILYTECYIFLIKSSVSSILMPRCTYLYFSLIYILTVICNNATHFIAFVCFGYKFGSEILRS